MLYGKMAYVNHIRDLMFLGSSGVPNSKLARVQRSTTPQLRSQFCILKTRPQIERLSSNRPKHEVHQIDSLVTRQPGDHTIVRSLECVSLKKGRAMLLRSLIRAIARRPPEASNVASGGRRPAVVLGLAGASPSRIFPVSIRSRSATSRRSPSSFRGAFHAPIPNRG